MADYKRMYALLCGAIDDTLDHLANIPQARREAEKLKAALLTAEEMYVSNDDNEKNNRGCSDKY